MINVLVKLHLWISLKTPPPSFFNLFTQLHFIGGGDSHNIVYGILEIFLTFLYIRAEFITKQVHTCKKIIFVLEPNFCKKNVRTLNLKNSLNQRLYDRQSGAELSQAQVSFPAKH